MDFKDLTYLLAIVKHQNITKAAESLYVSQPTLSKFLISLEKDLGLKLFRKLGNKYVLTYAGERYADRAAEILRQKTELDLELADILKRDIGVLNVAIAHMRCTYLLPETLPPFQKLHPNVKVNVFEGSSTENDQRLLEGQVEIAFYSRPSTPNPLIDYVTLAEEELLLCTCQDHPLRRFAQPNPASQYPRLDVNLLKNELIIMMYPNQRTRQIMDTYLAEHGIRFENVLYTSNLPAAMELVALGYGVAFFFEAHLRHRVQTHPIDCYSFGEPRTTTDFVAAYRKGSYLSRYARDFIELARRSSTK